MTFGRAASTNSQPTKPPTIEEWTDDMDEDVDESTLAKHAKEVEARYARRESATLNQDILNKRYSQPHPRMNILDRLAQKYGHMSDNDGNQAVGAESSHCANYLELEAHMTAMDEQSLNKLSTAQLIQRLRAHGQPFRGLKHDLVQRWQTYKQTQSQQ